MDTRKIARTGYTDLVSAWWDYVQRVTDGQKPAKIAETIGGNLAVSTVNSWKTAVPKRETVLAFADAYDAPRAEAILAAFLPPDEHPTVEATLRAASNKQLLDEVQRRMRAEGGGHAATSIHTPGEIS